MRPPSLIGRSARGRSRARSCLPAGRQAAVQGSVDDLRDDLAQGAEAGLGVVRRDGRLELFVDGLKTAESPALSSSPLDLTNGPQVEVLEELGAGHGGKG